MKKIFSNKKILLIVLSIVLLVILLSSYIRTKEIDLFNFFGKQEKKEDQFFFKENLRNDEFKKSINQKESEKTAKKDLELTKLSAENEKLDKIESIALISEIKDPFIQEKKVNTSTSQNTDQDLIFLEKNIVSKELKVSGQNENKNLLKSGKKQVDNDNLQEKKTQLDQNIKIPFQLLGIIKNKDNSTVIFNYQGKKVLKKENEKIDLFVIEKINNNNISLVYKNKVKTLNLWEKVENEN